MIKILHFYKSSTYDSFGGVENFIEQVSYGTSKHQIHNEFIAISKSPIEKEIYIKDLKVHLCKDDLDFASTPFSLSAIKKFKKIINNFDIVHYHFPYPFSDLLNILTRNKKKYIITYHSDIVKQKFLLKLYYPLMKYHLNGAEKIITTSPNYLESSKILQHYKDKVEVIPCGIDESALENYSSVLVDKYKNKYGEKFFFFVGRHVYYKGLKYLIEASKGCDYPIVIAGSGALTKDLTNLVKKYNLENVHLIGEVSDEEKYSLLKACYAFVFPSHLRSEAFGLSLLEGSMFGKPLISCEIGSGTTFINKHMLTGIVIKPANKDDLLNAMEYLWKNENKASEFGENSKERYQNLFKLDAMSESYADVYKDIFKTN